jgi:hypothetical protein
VKIKLLSAFAAGLLSAAPAFSATLDFQGAGAYNFIDNYYNGGTNDAGASGTNYGISFGPDALSIDNDEFFEYFSNAPTPGALSATGADAALNMAAGFSGEVSFWYSASENTTVSVYSGLNGSGSLLATFSLVANAQDGCSDTAYCNWDYASLNLAGIGQSIQFGTAAGVAGFDNVTVNEVPVPAAAWLLLSGLGGLGAVSRRRKAA